MELTCFTFFYFLIAAYFFRIWLKSFEQDTNLSPSERLVSLEILAIATLFWLIVVPLAYLELLQAKRKTSGKIGFLVGTEVPKFMELED